MSMRKAVMILIAAILLCGWNVNADSMADEETYEIVTVQDNDTLWDIATKKVDDRMDVRKYIYEVQQLNHLGDACILTPGRKQAEAPCRQRMIRQTIEKPVGVNTFSHPLAFCVAQKNQPTETSSILKFSSLPAIS